MTLPNNLILAGFKTIILCSVHSIRFVKYEFSTEIWFVKISKRIVKYESRVVKSNTEAVHGKGSCQNYSVFST